MIKNIKLNDVFCLDLEDMVNEAAAGKKALIIDLEVSASGKVTNGRIYPPDGHKAGLKSWTTPYAKPVLVHHNDKADPIGRFIGAEWQDLEHEALAFLKGDYVALAALKRAFASKDAQLIYSTMEKYNCFDAAWPGLGRVVGKIRIVDSDAIMKFKDQRYLTFSAGQTTDSFTCMKCSTDWFRGEQCEHQFLGSDEEGKPNYFLCGVMDGREVSPVNIPANPNSLPLRMEMADDADGGITLCITDSVQGAPIHIPDVTYDMENGMNLQDLQALELTTVLDLLADTQKLEEFTTALAAQDQKDTKWLGQLKDLLSTKHPQVDQRSTEVQKLHQLLDTTLPAPEPVVVDNTADATSKLAADIQQLRDMLTAITPKQEPTDGNTQKEEKVEVKVHVLDAATVVALVDWSMWDLALDRLVGDSRLTDEARAALDPKFFCGPDRLFPIANAQYVVAAHQLVDRARMSDAEKALVRQWIDSKAREAGVMADCKCGQPCESCKAKDAKYTELQKDYTAALTQLQDLTVRLDTVIRGIHTKMNSTDSLETKKLDDLVAWLDNVDFGTPQKTSAKALKPTENPSVTKTDHTIAETAGAPKIDRFVQSVINTYKKKLSDEGETEAVEYLKRNLNYLPNDFQISNYITKE